MGINRETKRAIQRDIDENPELYEALADGDEEDEESAEE